MSTTPSTPERSAPAAQVGDQDALPPGTRFGELEVLRVLGVGGFGIVYLARDHSLEREVALKEYMPAALASRGEGSQVTVRSGSFAETYAIGLRSFVNEARLLARFDHPSLVKVYRFWEDNGTAYMVMPYLQGRTLRDARRAMSTPPDEAWIRAVLDPVLSALELLHREDVFHRDIAPDNILLPPSGPPVLLDFGAARHVISDRTQSLTAILKPSYAPIEQYAEMTQLRQGPWTDVYALGAVVHYLLFGVPPSPATARAVQDDLGGLERRSVPGVSPRMLAVVAWALAVRPQARPQNVETLRAAFDGRVPIPSQGHADVTVPGPTALMPVGGAFEPTIRVDSVPTAPPPRRAAAPEAMTLLAPPAVRTVPSQRPAIVPPAAAGAAPRAGRGPWLAAAATAVVLAAGAAGWLAWRKPASAPVQAAAPAVLPVVVPAAVPTAVPASAAPAPVETPVAATVTPAPTAVAAPASTVDVAAASVAVPARAASRPAARPRPVPARPAAAPADTAVERPAPVPSADLRPNRAAVPPASTDMPKPVPAVAVPEGPASAREACGKRVFLALALCMEAQCQNPRFAAQGDCRRALEVRRRREMQ